MLGALLIHVTALFGASTGRMVGTRVFSSLIESAIAVSLSVMPVTFTVLLLLLEQATKSGKRKQRHADAADSHVLCFTDMVVFIAFSLLRVSCKNSIATFARFWAWSQFRTFGFELAHVNRGCYILKSPMLRKCLQGTQPQQVIAVWLRG
jgi:hypothetical protein